MCEPSPGSSGSTAPAAAATPRSVNVARRSVSFTTPRSTVQPSRVSGPLSNSSKRLSTAFKSPLRKVDDNVPASQSSAAETIETLQREVETLKRHDAHLDSDIEQLRSLGCREEDLKLYIDGLHAYNEMKDVGQMLLGRLAFHHGVTTRQMYGQFGLELED